MGVMCPECLRRKVITCKVCNGSKKDPRNRAKPCTYYSGSGTIKCDYCGETGEVPASMFNDRPK